MSNNNMSNNKKIKVGMIGCGFIGTALNEWLKQSNPDVETQVSDPPKGMNDEFRNDA